MRAAYFHCIAGASGDMFLGALVDAGLPLPELEAGLAHLPLGGYRLSARKARRGAIPGTQVTVEVTPEAPGPALSLEQVETLIGESTLPHPVREKALAVLRRLAQAEATVHRDDPGTTHDAGLGQVDTIVDVVGGVLGLHLLGVEAVYASPLPSGSGTVDSPHGVLPVPAPAVVELAALARAPLRPTPHIAAELTTPTGAALLTTLASFQAPDLAVERIGYGVGRRSLPDLPNVLAVWLGEVSPAQVQVVLLQTNIDDMTPQLHGYAMEQLLSLGALDVWFTPIQMKKNRPAVMLSLLAPVEQEAALVASLFRETTTLGVRRLLVGRHQVERESFTFTSSLGPVHMKRKRFQGEDLGATPEYEDCRRLAQEHGLPLQEVYHRLAREVSQAG